LNTSIAKDKSAKKHNSKTAPKALNLAILMALGESTSDTSLIAVDMFSLLDI